MTQSDAEKLAERLKGEGRFEIYRDNSDVRSGLVWLTESERDLIVSALRAEAPAGWKMVPVEPTYQMQMAGIDTSPMFAMPQVAAKAGRISLDTSHCANIYSAMLAASPSPPATRAENNAGEGHVPSTFAASSMASPSESPRGEPRQIRERRCRARKRSHK